ncbi:hypothetical protein [Mycobacterium sp. URHB0044]|jgi:hypothetical protein|uniref:hypothetical protein n=1 Tax=Mycobacterium sp. URHB0044 TaxID=1380386 RepID=UPI00048F0BE6|nr:hypothetical protein [Mycobacterium sp. URHB0044]
MSTATSSAVVGRRAFALVAVGSAVVHGLMLGRTNSAVLVVLVIAMAAACLYCARDLWKTSSTRAWCVVAVMNLGMVAVHWSAPGHHHAGVVDVAATIPTSTLMTVATAVSLFEAVVATAVLLVHTRGRAVSLVP